MPIVRFPVTPSVTAGSYSANDVVGGRLTFVGFRGGSIQSITIVDNSAQSVDYLLVLFESSPTDITDNNTYAIADADLPKIIKQLTLTAASHRQAFDNNAIYTLENLDVPLGVVGRAIFAFLITTGTPTYAATTDITVTIQVDPDYVSARQPGTTNIDAIQDGDTAGGALSGTYPDPTLASDAVDAIGEIAAAIKSGADGTVITGTAGTSGHAAQWDPNGDLVGQSQPVIGDFTNALHDHADAPGGGSVTNHTVASHSDTTGTGTELDTLTDGSNADSLHVHAGGAVALTANNFAVIRLFGH